MKNGELNVLRGKTGRRGGARAARGSAAPGSAILADGRGRPEPSSEFVDFVRQRKDDIAHKIRAHRERQVVLAAKISDTKTRQAFLKALAQHERDIESYWKRIRRNFRKVSRASEQQQRHPKLRQARPVSGARRLPDVPVALASYGGPMLDRRGRRGVYLSATYLSARTAAWDCARRLANYVSAPMHVERDANGLPLYGSNVGETRPEVADAFSVVEELNRAARANAKIVLHLILQLPHDIAPEQRAQIVARWCEESFGMHDLPYVWAVHTPDPDGDQRNYHAHVAVSFRPLVRIAPFEWDAAREVRTELDNPKQFRAMRESFATIMTQVCDAAGKNREYTAFSYAARGMKTKPTEKLGAYKTRLARSGVHVPADARNRMKIARNEAMLDIERLKRRRATLDARVGRARIAAARTIAPVQAAGKPMVSATFAATDVIAVRSVGIQPDRTRGERIQALTPAGKAWRVAHGQRGSNAIVPSAPKASGIHPTAADITTVVAVVRSSAALAVAASVPTDGVGAIVGVPRPAALPNFSIPALCVADRDRMVVDATPVTALVAVAGHASDVDGRVATVSIRSLGRIPSPHRVLNVVPIAASVSTPSDVPHCVTVPIAQRPTMPKPTMLPVQIAEDRHRTVDGVSLTMPTRIDIGGRAATRGTIKALITVAAPADGERRSDLAAVSASAAAAFLLSTDISQVATAHRPYFPAQRWLDDALLEAAFGAPAAVRRQRTAAPRAARVIAAAAPMPAPQVHHPRARPKHKPSPVIAADLSRGIDEIGTLAEIASLNAVSLMSGTPRSDVVERIRRADAYVGDDDAGHFYLGIDTLEALGLSDQEIAGSAAQAGLAEIRLEQQRSFAALQKAASERPLDFARSGSRRWPADLAAALVVRLDHWQHDDAFQNDLLFIIDPILDQGRREEARRQRDTAYQKRAGNIESRSQPSVPIADDFGGYRTTPIPIYRAPGEGVGRVAAFDPRTQAPSRQLLMLIQFAGQRPDGIDLAMDKRLITAAGAPPMIASLVDIWRHDDRVHALVTKTVSASRAAKRPVWPKEVAHMMARIPAEERDRRSVPPDWDDGITR